LGNEPGEVAVMVRALCHLTAIGALRMRWAGLTLLARFALLGLAGVPHPGLAQPAPEGASGWQAKPAVQARRHMVASAHPLASEAALEIMRAGGNAIDAALAAQFVLTLVEPQSSGIGGGAFLMFWDARRQRVEAWDGRETAPQAVNESLFLDARGQPMRFFDAVVGGRSVGVPGVMRLFDALHRQHGKLAWARLFEPAIRLAEDGFPIGARLASLLARETHLREDPTAAAYFFDANGKPHPAGYRLRNPALAATLRLLAQDGANAFYQGPIAADIVAKVRGHVRNPGLLSLDDLARYQAKAREPVCIAYRAWEVCGMPPPSSGGIAIAQILGMLAHTPLPTLRPEQGVPQAAAIHLYSEAARLAYADRNAWVADSDFVPLPHGLLDPTYLRQRAALIGPRSLGPATAGTPPQAPAPRTPDSTPERPATTHLSIIDEAGNAVAMTSSIENAFGARLMVRGFLLNNQLTDFSFTPSEKGQPVANRVEGGKRPRSSMAPTLVFKKSEHPLEAPRRLLMSLGSPGGSSIINYVAKTLIASLDWGLNLQQAVEMVHFGSRNGPTEIEPGRLTREAEQRLVDSLKTLGHDVRLVEQTSGLQGIERIKRTERNPGDENGWLGAADPRREGVVMGD